MSIWGHPFLVRIHYPSRKGKGGKRDLVKGMPSHGAAVIYARKVAERGAGMEAWRHRPVACVYDVKNWNAPVECYAGRPPESTKSPGYYTRGDIRVRRVPATFSGLRRRKRRC